MADSNLQPGDGGAVIIKAGDGGPGGPGAPVFIIGGSGPNAAPVIITGGMGGSVILPAVTSPSEATPKPWEPRAKTRNIIKAMQQGLDTNAIVNRYGISNKYAWTLRHRAKKAGLLNPDSA